MAVKTIRNLVGIFIVVVLLGFLLMVTSYSLPMGNAHDNLINDAPALYDLNQLLIPNDYSTKLDIYTDSLILTESAYYNESASVVDNAMSVYGTTGDDKEFQRYIEGDENVIFGYPRYWHGNLVVYKVLYSFLDYNSIKILEFCFEIVMIIAILKLMVDNDLKNYIIPFLMSIYLIHPEVIGLSLQFSTLFNLMLISVFLMLKFKKVLFKKRIMLYYFMVLGMLTVFFDLLTYPLVCLGVPLIFYVILENDNQSLKEIIINIIVFSALWGIGYVGMWLSKWIIASILLNKNVVLDAVNQLLFRTSSLEFTRMDAVLANVSVYSFGFYLLIPGLTAIYYIIRLIRSYKGITIDKLKSIIPFVLVGLTPFLWYFIISNHSYIHFWFTYRELIIDRKSVV